MCVGMHAYMYTRVNIHVIYLVFSYTVRPRPPFLPPSHKSRPLWKVNMVRNSSLLLLYYLSLYESTLAVYRSKSGVVEVDQIKMGTFQEHAHYMLPIWKIRDKKFPVLLIGTFDLAACDLILNSKYWILPVFTMSNLLKLCLFYIYTICIELT